MILFWVKVVCVIIVIMSCDRGIARRLKTSYCIELRYVGLVVWFRTSYIFFVSLFVADHIWGHADHVLFWSASRDWSGLRCEDRVVLSSRPVYPRARSLHHRSGALPSGFIARSCQPVLSITSISTQKHFSLNLEYLEVKFYVILTSQFLHRCLHEQNSS